MKRENNESSIFGLCFVLSLIVLFEFRKPHPFLTETREGVRATRDSGVFGDRGVYFRLAPLFRYPDSEANQKAPIRQHSGARVEIA